MATDLVPLGKYKGQPVSALAQDRPYCDWLTQQSWFVQKFPELHTLIINNFGEPTETPEHNRLQLRFLDNTFRLRCSWAVLEYVHGKGQIWCCGDDDYGPGTPCFEKGAVDVQWLVEWFHTKAWRERVRRRPVDDDNYATIAIECKPSLGDDYPAVLRWMKTCHVEGTCLEQPTFWALVVDSFTALGGSWEEVKRFFDLSGILLMTTSEVDTYQLPEWDEGRFA